MTECEEVARAMYPAYVEWLARTNDLRTMDAARAFVREQMPDEGATIRDNVAHALYRMSGRIEQ